MIKIENISVMNLDGAFRGLRNPMNSWDKSDSGYCYRTDCPNCPDAEINDQEIICHNSLINNELKDTEVYPPHYVVGPKDLDLARRMIKAGDSDSKFLRQIFVSMDITAPLYFVKELDQYKVGTTTDSCSTMHKIASKEFTLDDFSCEHLWGDKEERDVDEPIGILNMVIDMLNAQRIEYLANKDKETWWQMIQLLPSSYNQKRTWTGSYANLRNMYHQRKLHKLDEWRDFCKMIEGLPYAKELITISE